MVAQLTATKSRLAPDATWNARAAGAGQALACEAAQHDRPGVEPDGQALRLPPGEDLHEAGDRLLVLVGDEHALVDRRPEVLAGHGLSKSGSSIVRAPPCAQS